jgi:hypothetical protein
VSGVYDYAGPDNHSRITWLPCCLPPLGTESPSCTIGFSKLNSPAHLYTCLRFSRHLAMSPCKTRGQDGFATSFPVGLLHPLQHAGLARSSDSAIMRSLRTKTRGARLAEVNPCFSLPIHTRPALLEYQTSRRYSWVVERSIGSITFCRSPRSAPSLTAAMRRAL